MTEQFTDLVESSAGGHHVGGESVAQLVRVDSPGQPSASRQIGEQFVESRWPHMSAQWFAKEIDQQEITLSRLRARVSFQHVLIECLHDHPVHRHNPGSAGFRGRSVDVVSSTDVHVLPADAAAKPRGVGYEVDVFHPQPGQLAAALANAPQRQHDKLVPSVAACSDERQNLLTGDRVDNALRFGKPMPRLSSHTELRPAANVAGQVVVLDHVEQGVQNAVIDLADGGGVAEELADCRQHHVDPTRPPHDARNCARGAVGVEVLQPVDETPELTGGRAPVAFDRCTPLEEQRQCAGVGLRGRLGAITAKAQMQEPVVGRLDWAITQIDHGPVALARWQFDPKRSERPHQVRRYGLRPPATVSDTPSGRVVDGPESGSLRPSPTPSAPGQNDLFHAKVTTSFIREVFEVMRVTPQHTYQILTKRSLRLARVADKLDWPPNVWVGVSVEDSKALARIDHLRNMPSAVRFLSCEPLLGPLEGLNLDQIDWVIAGGESGPNYRPMQGDWVRGVRDTCRDFGVAFFFKQWGGRTPKAMGRVLDGQTWNQMPSVSAALV